MKKTVALMALALVTALLPAVPALAAPTIQLLNPSPYATTNPVPEISDKGSRPVHLVAWVNDIPASPLVEFEIRPVQGGLPGQGTATIDAVRVGNDTWEGFFVIPDNFADGQYTIEARLFSQLDEVANDSQNVTLNQSDVPPPAASETVEIVRPENGGQLGFFTPLGKRTNTVINGVVSSGTRQVRGLYTMSDPGTQPDWAMCGSGAPDSNLNVTVRCTLREGDNPAQVTAVGLVANTTPRPASPDPAADEAGDAHRIAPYLQEASTVVISPESSTQKAGECAALLTAVLFDQFSRVVAGANLDVHAEGPDDQLTFATDDTAGGALSNTDAYKAPDKGHVSREPTPRCSDNRESGVEQGVHRVIGTADREHIESVDGTNNDGSFVFGLVSSSPGTTNVTAWADLNDDDSQSVSEASGAAGIGWDQSPPPPRRQLFIDPDGPTTETGSCQALTLVAREGGNSLIGVNVDVHITGPDASVTFCDPPGASPRRAPDQGEHLGDTHTDSTSKHTEGETDATGRFVFGVTAASDGRTDVLAWIDESEDDSFTPAEPSAPAQVTFAPRGDRTISLNANRRRVPQGRRVRLFGEIAGSEACESAQAVKLKAKRPGGRFRTIDSTVSSSDGSYSFRTRIRRTRDYKAIAPRDGVCQTAKSNTVRVRVR